MSRQQTSPTRRSVLLTATALIIPSIRSSRAQTTNKLVLLDYIGGQNAQTLNEYIARFIEENPGFEISRQRVPQNQYQNVVLQRAAAGQPADILIIDNPMTPALADAGILQPIDEYLDGLDMDKLYYPGPLSSVRWRGKTYALPNGNNAEILVYNKRLLDAARLPVPTTQPELAEAAAKLTHGGVYGFCAAAYGGEECTWNWLPYLWNRGGDLDELHSQTAVDALAYWGAFVRRGYSPAAQLSWQTADIEPRFVNGQLAMATIGSWQLRKLDKEAKASGLEYGIAVLPSATKPGDKPIIPFGGEVVAIGAMQPEKARAAWRFIQWLHKPQMQLRLIEQFGEVPNYLPMVDEFRADLNNAIMTAVFDQMPNSRSRTQKLGARYYDVSARLTVAIQGVMTGMANPKSALAAI